MRRLERARLEVDARVVTAEPRGDFEQPYLVVGLEPNPGDTVRVGQTVVLSLVGVTDLQDIGLRVRSERG